MQVKFSRVGMGIHQFSENGLGQYSANWAEKAPKHQIPSKSPKKLRQRFPPFSDHIENWKI